MSPSELTLPPMPASGVESKLAEAAIEVSKEALVASSSLPSSASSSDSPQNGPDCDDRTLATMEKSMAGKSIVTRSSLLEAAKKLCNQLDEKSIVTRSSLLEA